MMTLPRTNDDYPGQVGSTPKNRSGYAVTGHGSGHGKKNPVTLLFLILYSLLSIGVHSK